MTTPSPRSLALGLEAEWILLNDRTLQTLSPNEEAELRDELLIYITEVETLLSLTAFEQTTIVKARQLALADFIRDALVSLHPLIYFRGQSDRKLKRQ